MKLLRILYFASIPVFLVIGLYTGLAVHYIVFFTQLFIILVLLGLYYWMVYSFRFTQKLKSDLGSGGGETQLKIKILNPRPIPIALMEISVATANPCDNEQLSFSLAPFEEKSFDIKITMPYCGVYDLGMTKLRLTDILGLMPLPFDMRKLSFYRQPQLMVYPAVEALSSLSASLLDEKLFSSSYLKLAEEGDSVSGLRKYRDGDAAKRIHWKRSISLGELYVKQYEHPLRQKVFIVIDVYTHKLKDEARYIYSDTVCRTAAALCRHSLLRRREVNLFAMSYPGEKLSRCVGDNALEPFLKWLAQLRFDNQVHLKTSLEAALSASDEATAIFVITREPDSGLMSILEQASVKVGSVSLVRIENETAYDGRLHTMFVEPGGSVSKSLEVDV